MVRAVAPSLIEKSDGCRKGGNELDAGSATGGQRSNTASRQIANDATSQDAAKTYSGVEKIWGALYCHLDAIIFVLRTAVAMDIKT